MSSGTAVEVSDKSETTSSTPTTKKADNVESSGTLRRQLAEDLRLAKYVVNIYFVLSCFRVVVDTFSTRPSALLCDVFTTAIYIAR